MFLFLGGAALDTFPPLASQVRCGRLAAGFSADLLLVATWTRQSLSWENWKNSLWRQAGGTNEYLSNCRLNHQSFPVASCKSGPPDTHQIMADFQKYCAIIPTPSQQIPSLKLLSAAHMRLAIQLWTWLHCRDLRWWWPLGAPSLAGQWSAKILPLFRGFLARPCGTSSAATTISRFSDGHWAPKKNGYKEVGRSWRDGAKGKREGVKIWTENSRLKVHWLTSWSLYLVLWTLLGSKTYTCLDVFDRIRSGSSNTMTHQKTACMDIASGSKNAPATSEALRRLTEAPCHWTLAGRVSDTYPWPVWLMKTSFFATRQLAKPESLKSFELSACVPDRC